MLEIAPASGSQFALLPPDNATGNFTKVVQRVPVKIALDDSPLLVAVAARAIRGRNCPHTALMESNDGLHHHYGSGQSPIQLRAMPLLGRCRLILSKSPVLGILGVIIGAGVVTLTGRMISLGLADLKGGLGFGFDDGAWISSAYNIALMFIGPFTVYVGALLGPRRGSVLCRDFVYR